MGVRKSGLMDRRRFAQSSVAWMFSSLSSGKPTMKGKWPAMHEPRLSDAHLLLQALSGQRPGHRSCRAWLPAAGDIGGMGAVRLRRRGAWPLGLAGEV